VWNTGVILSRQFPDYSCNSSAFLSFVQVLQLVLILSLRGSYRDSTSREDRLLHEGHLLQTLAGLCWLLWIDQWIHRRGLLVVALWVKRTMVGHLSLRRGYQETGVGSSNY
jgi:hypothetical protein